MSGGGKDFVEADSWVWFRHETERWLPCRVQTGGAVAELKDQQGRLYQQVPAKECHPMHESSLVPVANMVELGDLNEAAILHNLRVRYREGDTYPGGMRCDVQIFTYIGPILVSCNPYKGLPIFNEEFIKLYYNKVRAPPSCAARTSGACATGRPP